MKLRWQKPLMRVLLKRDEGFWKWKRRRIFEMVEGLFVVEEEAEGV